MKNNTSLIYGLCLVIGDFLALVAAFVVAYILRVSVSHSPLIAQIHARTYLGIFLVLLPFWILIFALLGLYQNNIQEKRFVEAGRLLIGSFIGLLFVISYAYFDGRQIFPARLVPLYAFGLGFAFLLVFRNLLRTVRGALFRYGVGVTNLLLVGDTNITRELVRLLPSIASGYRIVGVVDGESRKDRLRYFGSFTSATKSLSSNDIHGIVQTELYADAAKNNEILEYSQANHIAYRFVPGNADLFVGHIDLQRARTN